MHREHGGQRAERVAGDDIEFQRGAGELDGIAVGNRHIALRRLAEQRIALGAEQRVALGFLERVPVDLAHHQARIEFLLEILRAAVVIAMGMADHDIADLGRIEPELAQAALDIVFGLVGIIHGIDDDDAAGGFDRPCRGPSRTQKIQFVHHLHRL
ncbi:MAG TPA: hypothetical protein VN831_02750 [Bradyrhizobium sp.]|nr:hypothetical protein [Bradyrhizobium sp.]